MASKVHFTLNGKAHSVDVEEAAGKTLNEYIRTGTEFSGTKVSCAQGGCGACTVGLARPSEAIRSVPSCLVPLASVHGAALITVEGLQGADGAPHPISERLAKFNGSQCGFCTPGMVMQLYSTLSNKDGGKALEEKDMEQCINGNVCRCTGYRPIMQCAKSFASDTTMKNPIDPSTSIGPYETVKDPKLHFPAEQPLSGSRWLRPRHVREVLSAMAAGASPIAGGTAAGIYYDLSLAEANAANRVLVDLTSVSELGEVSEQPGALRFGASVTWTRFCEALDSVLAKGKCDNPTALTELRARAGSIAGSQVRNQGTIGGNVAITRNRGFLSDWMPLLAALGASVEVADSAGTKQRHNLLSFVQEKTQFNGLVLAVLLPLPGPDVVFRCFRVAKRSRNAHALSNCGFAASVTGGRVSQATVVLGCADPKPVRLKNLERALTGMKESDLSSSSVSGVLENLCEKVKSDLFPLACDFGRDQTEHIVTGYVVKFLSTAFKATVPKEWSSAEYCLHDMERCSTATQSWPTPTDLGGPLNKPMTKTTALEQTTGRAKYTDDVAKPFGTLNAALVLCPEANVAVTGIDDSGAKAMLGDNFHSLITAQDLKTKSVDLCAILGLGVPPSYNDFDTTNYFLLPFGEPSKYAGQAVALLLAHGDNLRAVERAADRCAEGVRFERKGEAMTGFPLIGGEEVTVEPLVVKKGKEPSSKALEAARLGSNGTHLVTGRFKKKSQSHFYIEGQTLLTVPDEDGITCYVACQGADIVQQSISKATGLVQSKISVKYRRVGGGFGGKFQLPAMLGGLTAQAALLTRLPIRLVPPRETDMMLNGGRPEIEAKWQAAVESRTGKILALDYDIWQAHGASEDLHKVAANLMASAIDEVYSIPSISAAVHFVKQHVPPRTSVRAPGHFEATLFMEAVIDGVAAELKMPGHLVREKNFAVGKFNKSNLVGGIIPGGFMEGNSHPALWSKLKSKVKYEERVQAVEEFNRSNAWKKRGISMTPARYGMMLAPGNVARVDIFKDGSVQIAVSGSEIGQGLHTKVGQMVSTMFQDQLGHGPPMSLIRFLDTSTEQNPNGPLTGGSTTSEAALFAAGDAVRQLVSRLLPAAKKARTLPADKRSEKGPWNDILDTAFGQKFMDVLVVPVNLSAVGLHLTPPTEMMYETYGVMASEVELDVLTGEHRVLFAHLLFDVGKSYNPAIDIGQMEGAFIMGMGQIQNEGIDNDPMTGKLLTVNTWSYKPPIACDVPENFHVELLDMEKERLNNPFVEFAMWMAAPIVDCLAIPWKATKTEKKYKSSKAIGEPPVLLASGLQSALHNAVVAAKGGALSENMLPIPAKPFVVLPLLEGQKPGGGSDNVSTATGTSMSSSRAVHTK